MEEHKKFNETASKQPRHPNENTYQTNFDVKSVENKIQDSANSSESMEESNRSEHSQQNKLDSSQMLLNESKLEKRDWRQESDHSNLNSQKPNDIIKKEIIPPDAHYFESLRNDRLSDYVPKEEDQNDVRTSSDPYITKSNESSFQTEIDDVVNYTESQDQSNREDHLDARSDRSKPVPLNETVNNNQNRDHHFDSVRSSDNIANGL